MSSLFTRLGLGAILALPFYIVLRCLYLKRKKGQPEVMREILLCLFVLFMAGLIVLVLWPGNLSGQSSRPLIRAAERLRSGRGMNAVPFHTIGSYFTGGFDTGFIINIVANVLMFSPLGLCLPLFWQRFQRWWKLLFIGAAFSSGIETAQLFVGRSVDIDDVILNTAGVVLGYGVFVLLVCLLPGVRSKWQSKRPV